MKTQRHTQWAQEKMGAKATSCMGDEVLVDFRGKDCAFVANWLRGKGLNKLCAVFEVFKF